MGGVPYPAETGMMVDRRDTGQGICCNACVGWYYRVEGGNGSMSPDSFNPHNEGSNVAFVDGHVKWYMGGAYGDIGYPGLEVPSGIRWYIN